MNSGNYKLHYFGGNGRASISRAILSVGAPNFENVIIGMDQWGSLKTSGTYEFQQLPLLEHKGKKYTQSIAIDLYLARQFKLYGKHAEDEYQIDSLLCTFDDLFPTICKIAFAFSEEEKKQVEANKKTLIEKLNLYYAVFEKRYIANGTKKYFLGDHFSLADIYLTVLMNNIHNIVKEQCPGTKVAPNLVKLITRVKENELKTYFEKYFDKESLF